MGMLVISGCYQSGWEKILAAFPATTDFSDSFDKLFYASESLDPVKIRQPLVVTPLLQEEISKRVADRQQAPLIIPDSRNAWILDFWAERFPEARFLLFYSDVGNAFANAFLAGIAPQQFLDCWLSTNRQFLAFQRRYRQRTVLLNAESAAHHPGAMNTVLQQFGIVPGVNLATAAIPPVELPTEGLLAGNLLAGQAEVRLLSGELEASAQPLAGHELPPSFPTPAELFAQYQRRKTADLEIQVKLNEGKRQHQALESAYKEAVQENELLILQLQQVQEELEATFLQKQQLELACDRVVPQPQQPVREGTKPPSAKSKNKGLLKKLRDLFKGKKGREKAQRKLLSAQVKLLRDSGLFNEEWYLRRYPDVARAGIDPVKHYLKHGVAEARNPSPDFDTQCYLAANPDVVASGMNPLVHYLSYGKKEGRKPMKAIDLGREFQ